MRRSPRLSRRLLTIAVISLVASGLPLASGKAQDTSTSLDGIGRLEIPGGEQIPAAEKLLELGDLFRVSGGDFHVVVISSGVDTSVFPASIAEKIAVHGNAGDPVGYGTYVTSVIAQVAPSARISSIRLTNSSGKFQPDWQKFAFDWVLQNSKDVDAVLYAIPPREFLDPVAAFMAAGIWNEMIDIIDTRSLAGSSGPVFGAALSDTLALEQTRNLSEHEYTLFKYFRSLTMRWLQASAQLQTIVKAGVPVVVPAGDLGPNLQTILGIANLPEVTTVGGFNGTSVSPTSSSGPSMEGTVKPDLLAPSSIVGILPENSILAKSLDSRGLLDNTLTLQWDAGEPATQARALLDTTMTAAAIVAASMGGLNADGMDTVALQQGALSAAAVPIDGIPVWQQGAGALEMVPDQSFASSRPVALSSADLGAEPDSGVWSFSVDFAQGSPEGAATTVAHLAATRPDATTSVSTLASGDAPPIGASVDQNRVVVTLPLGNDSYEGGLYCGYTDVLLPLTSETADSRATAAGIPEGTEQVPTCFVEGTRLSALGFYIHDLPAENLTWSLMPALPPQASILDRPLMIVRNDPRNTRVFVQTTGADGFAQFPNVPLGYYRLRLWADYAAPTTQTLTDSQGQQAILEQDIGEAVGYQSFDALVLSAVCSEQIANPFTCELEPGVGCSQQYLEQIFGPANVEHEKPTGSYLVGPKSEGPKRLRVAFGFVKKMPGPTVSSRYIDLLGYDDMSYFSLPLIDAVTTSDLISGPVSDGLQAWEFAAGSDGPDTITALFNPAAMALHGTKASIGLAKYHFNMTTPNFTSHMSLNFSYELENALILVGVEAGGSTNWAALVPKGTVDLPATGLSTPVTLSGFEIIGSASGAANFEFKMLPAGDNQGTLLIVFVPYLGLPVSSASLSDLSFELDTWGPTIWPARTFGSPDYDTTTQGHSFSVSPNYTERQVSAGNCRNLDSGAYQSEVCEDWAVLVHTPGDDAAVFDIVAPNADGGMGSIVGDLQVAGAKYFDPKRGVTDFTKVFATASASIGAVEADVRVARAGKTNGIFWEVMALPFDVVKKFETLEFRIRDNVPGRGSDLLPHVEGSVPVSPYVPFVRSATFLG